MQRVWSVPEDQECFSPSQPEAAVAYGPRPHAEDAREIVAQIYEPTAGAGDAGCDVCGGRSDADRDVSGRRPLQRDRGCGMMQWLSCL